MVLKLSMEKVLDFLGKYFSIIIIVLGILFVVFNSYFGRVYNNFFGEIIKYSCTSIICYKNDDLEGNPKCFMGWNKEKKYKTGFTIDTKKNALIISEADSEFSYPIEELSFSAYRKGMGLSFVIRKKNKEYFFNFNETNYKYEYWYRTINDLQQRHSEKGLCTQENNK